MTLDPKQLIDGYLDETLASEEHAKLNQWLKGDPENSRQFAAAMLLHDRLRSEHLSLATMGASQSSSTVAARGDDFPPQARSTATPRRFRPIAASVGIAIAATLLVVVLWKGLGDTPASAAAVEINRIIATNARSTDRTYQITFEEAVTPPRRGDRPGPVEDGRPPKVPMDGAVLQVRSGGQFVPEGRTPPWQSRRRLQFGAGPTREKQGKEEG